MRFFLFAFLLSNVLLADAKMTLEEKVGQLLIVHFRGDEVNSDAKTLVNELKVGGIIYYNWANGLEEKEKVRNLSAGLQKLAKKNRNHIPLFISVDQEGGKVNRLNQGFTYFPGLKTLGLTQDEKFLESVGFISGNELKAVGINLNFAPVVDIATHSDSVMVERSFGDDPHAVTKLASGLMAGYKKANVLTSLKHFPGHGDVKTDSHEVLPILDKTKEELEKEELVPYKSLLNQADMIMTGHILVPTLDKKNAATHSSEILGNLLRKEMGYEGVIISDSLVMKGALKNVSSVDEAAKLAFQAGCDILLLGGRRLQDNEKDAELTVADIKRIRDYLVQEVRLGHISEKRLNESVKRILKLKESL